MDLESLAPDPRNHSSELVLLRPFCHGFPTVSFCNFLCCHENHKLLPLNLRLFHIWKLDLLTNVKTALFKKKKKSKNTSYDLFYLIKCLALQSALIGFRGHLTACTVKISRSVPSVTGVGLLSQSLVLISTLPGLEDFHRNR